MNRLKTLVAIAALFAVLAPVRAQVGKSQGLLDANRATQQELTAVPHLNADLVKAIMDRRPFGNVTELGAALTPALNRGSIDSRCTEKFSFTPTLIRQPTMRF